MFKIGDKAKGFKFDNSNESGVHWDSEMDFYVDKIGEVVEIYNDAFVIQFGDTLEWMYPLSLAHLAVVEEATLFKVGDKVVHFKDKNKFCIGDKVKFKKSSLETGMIDASEEEEFTVEDTDGIYAVQINQSGKSMTYNSIHLEHVKEETMNTNEEQSINWEVGQEVWCLLRGKGQVNQVAESSISVWFNNFGAWAYTKDGEFSVDSKYPRTLFFSEPKIEAELFPPKKPFVPILKKGDKVVLTDGIADYVTEVVREEEHTLYYKTEDGVVTFVKKSAVKVHKLGEEIKFS